MDVSQLISPLFVLCLFAPTQQQHLQCAHARIHRRSVESLVTPTSSTLTYMSEVTLSHRERLVRFYEHYNTEKLATIDVILDSFEGNEDELFNALTARYGPEPLLTESSVQQSSVQPTQSAKQEGRTETIRQMLMGPREGSEARSAAPDTTAAPQRTSDDSAVQDMSLATPLSVRRQRGRAIVAADPSATDKLVNGLQQTSSSSLLHIHQRLQRMLSVMVEQDPSPYLEEGLRKGAGPLAGDTLDIMQGIAQFRSLAAAFVEECTPLVLRAEAVAAMQREEGSPNRGAEAPRNPDGRCVAGGSAPSSSMHQQGGAVLPPEGPRASVLAARISEGVLTLQPGQYYENLVVAPHTHLELRTSYVGAVVELHPLDPFHPVVSVGPHAELRINGVRFVGAASNGPTMYIHGSSIEVALQNCEFCEGGIVLQGMDATLRCSDCLFLRCAYAAIYAKSGCFVSIEASNFEDGDSALRCRDATFAMSRSTVVRSASDACVCHGSVEGTIEATEFDTGIENGVLLSPSSAVLMTECTVRSFDRFGLYAPSGARFHLAQCQLDGNGLGPSNRAATGSWVPRRDMHRENLQ